MDTATLLMFILIALGVGLCVMLLLWWLPKSSEIPPSARYAFRTSVIVTIVAIIGSVIDVASYPLMTNNLGSTWGIGFIYGPFLAICLGGAVYIISDIIFSAIKKQNFNPFIIGLALVVALSPLSLWLTVYLMNHT